MLTELDDQIVEKINNLQKLETENRNYEIEVVDLRKQADKLQVIIKCNRDRIKELNAELSQLYVNRGINKCQKSDC